MRMLAVADVYEALTATRPYRPALTEDEALETIRRDVPRRLDADAYEALGDGDRPAARRLSGGRLVSASSHSGVSRAMTASSASTTSGANCVPELSRSSAIATDSGSALR